MDSITKYRIDRKIELYGDKVADRFAEEFNKATLHSNPVVAVEMLEYLNEALYKVNSDIQLTLNKYEQASNLKDQVKNLCSYSNEFKTNKIKNISEIYKYIWNCISDVVEDDGSIKYELPFDDEF